MPECNQDKLSKNCACTYTTCSRRGRCCECVEYHLRMDQLPGCVFAKLSKDAERSYDRDFEHFAKLILKK